LILSEILVFTDNAEMQKILQSVGVQVADAMSPVVDAAITDSKVDVPVIKIPKNPMNAQELFEKILAVVSKDELDAMAFADFTRYSQLGMNLVRWLRRASDGITPEMLESRINSSEDSAANLLRTTVHNLRKFAGKYTINFENGKYRLEKI
jgi:hypothetical protein